VLYKSGTGPPEPVWRNGTRRVSTSGPKHDGIRGTDRVQPVCGGCGMSLAVSNRTTDTRPPQDTRMANSRRSPPSAMDTHYRLRTINGSRNGAPRGLTMANSPRSMCARAALITAASSVISTIASTVIFARRMGSGPPARRDPGAAGAGGRGPDGRPAIRYRGGDAATAVAGWSTRRSARRRSESPEWTFRQYGRTEACRGGYLPRTSGSGNPDHAATATTARLDCPGCIRPAGRVPAALGCPP
jgi:hypothetical protein